MKYLDKKCIVIPFDDIDTDFQKGFEILEVIRKFLTTPQIITVITGDLELYSKLVRKSKWVFFDKDFLEKEISYSKHSKEEFSEMIDQLENQYLMKILKPENRILLGTIKEYMEEPNFEILVKFKENENGDRLIKYYEDLIIKLGFNKEDDSLKKELISFLMNLSFRVQIQLLTLLKEVTNNVNIDVTTGLLNIFWNDINQKADNPKELLGKNEKYSVNMLRYLVDTNKLYTNSNFLPESDNKIINKALLAIGSRFNQLLGQHNHLMFDYWLRISYIQYTTDALGGANKVELLKDFLNFIQFNSETSLHKMVGLGQAYCNCELNTPNREKMEKETLPGIIYLGNESPVIFGTNAILANIPMMGTLDVSKQEFVFLSIYRLLAVIGEFLTNFSVKSAKNDNFSLMVSKYGQYRNFMEPNKYSMEVLKNDVLYNFEYFSIIEDYELNTDLHDKFVEWRKSEVKVSTPLLNKIFTRFYNTMINIDVDKSYINAAMKFNAYIIALWNAALVECELEGGYYVFLDLNNNRDIESTFIDNLKEYLSHDKYRNNKYVKNVFEWLFECPMLKLYINPLLLYFLEDSKRSNDSVYMKGLLRYDRIESSRKTLQAKIELLMKQYNRYDQIQSWIDKYSELKDLERRIRVYERDFFKTINISEKRDLEVFITELKRKEEALRTSLKNVEEPDLQIDITVNSSESSVRDIELNIKNTMRILMDKRREYINKLAALKPVEKSIANFVKDDYIKIKEKRESYANKTTYDYLSKYVI